HSAAMIADAVHSLSDFFTDIIVILFVNISGKPEDKTHNYGHGKFETLATTIIGGVLMLVGFGILINGGRDIAECIKGNYPPTPGKVALIAAIISIVFKELIYQYTVRAGKGLNSQALVANAWHHRSDAFSSIGTLVGIGGAILLGDGWQILDPIAAVVVSSFIIKVAVDLLKPSLEELLEKSLPAEVEQRIVDIILSFPDIGEPHHLRTRRIGNNIAIEVHIRMDGNMSLNQAHHLTTLLERRLKEEFGELTHIGIHTEPKKE
ncbi:MAG: cation transporter, partial [Alistipes sp.]|nr:cation transporter [Alistipes sp.]